LSGLSRVTRAPATRALLLSDTVPVTAPMSIWASAGLESKVKNASRKIGRSEDGKWHPPRGTRQAVDLLWDRNSTRCGVDFFWMSTQSATIGVSGRALRCRGAQSVGYSPVPADVRRCGERPRR